MIISPFIAHALRGLNVKELALVQNDSPKLFRALHGHLTVSFPSGYQSLTKQQKGNLSQTPANQFNFVTSKAQFTVFIRVVESDNTSRNSYMPICSWPKIYGSLARWN